MHRNGNPEETSICLVIGLTAALVLLKVDNVFHGQDNEFMVTDVENHDLRVLSLLHALCDKEEFIREAVRLLSAPGFNETVWEQVCGMALDVAPGHSLFDAGKTLDQLRSEFIDYPRDGGRRIICDRRKGERRSSRRRSVSDRRSDERRAVGLPWVGLERRALDRRITRRRIEDLFENSRI